MLVSNSLNTLLSLRPFLHIIIYLSKSLLKVTIASASTTNPGSRFQAPVQKNAAPHISIKLCPTHLTTMPSSVGHFHPAKRVPTDYPIVPLFISLLLSSLSARQEAEKCENTQLQIQEPAVIHQEPSYRQLESSPKQLSTSLETLGLSLIELYLTQNRIPFIPYLYKAEGLIVITYNHIAEWIVRNKKLSSVPQCK